MLAMILGESVIFGESETFFVKVLYPLLVFILYINGMKKIPPVGRQILAPAADRLGQLDLGCKRSCRISSSHSSFE